jgi:hypothetical protein
MTTNAESIAAMNQVYFGIAGNYGARTSGFKTQSVGGQVRELTESVECSFANGWAGPLTGIHLHGLYEGQMIGEIGGKRFVGNEKATS